MDCFVVATMYAYTALALSLVSVVSPVHDYQQPAKRSLPCNALASAIYCGACVCWSGITCCHGHLAPEALSPAAKRVLVSAVTWGKLRELWVTQVLREVASRRNKTAKQAAAKELAAPTSDGEANGEKTTGLDMFPCAASRAALRHMQHVSWVHLTSSVGSLGRQWRALAQGVGHAGPV